MNLSPCFYVPKKCKTIQIVQKDNLISIVFLDKNNLVISKYKYKYMQMKEFEMMLSQDNGVESDGYKSEPINDVLTGE